MTRGVPIFSRPRVGGLLSLREPPRRPAQTHGPRKQVRVRRFPLASPCPRPAAGGPRIPVTAALRPLGTDFLPPLPSPGPGPAALDLAPLGLPAAPPLGVPELPPACPDVAAAPAPQPPLPDAVATSGPSVEAPGDPLNATPTGAVGAATPGPTHAIA